MKSKTIENILYSTVGVVAMLLIVIVVNFLAGVFRYRVDLTQEKLYTLSPGTRAILDKLDGKLKIRFYCTQKDSAMDARRKNHAKLVEDLLMEYKKAAHGRIEIEKLDPQPDTDAEDFARMDGVEPQPVSMTDSIYLGLSFSYLDEKVAIPYLEPSRDKLLEYDISRAIAQVINPQKQRAVIGVMSGVQVFGQNVPPMMRRGQRGPQPWMFIQELQRDFTVKQIGLDVDKIDDDVKILIVHHPKGITDKAQFAIDQFVLRGGKLVAFLDPVSVMDQPQNPMFGGPQGGSNLDKLLKAWGVEFDSNNVLVDLTLKSALFNERFQALLPSLSPEYLKKDEIITSQLDNLTLALAGAFTNVSPAEGLKADILMRSSSNSMLVASFLAQMGGEAATRDFRPSGKSYALGVRLTGKFKTAFPNGKPEDKSNDAEKKDEKKEDKKEDFLKASTNDNVVVLVGDSDMLHEQFCYNMQMFPFVQVISGNMAFLQSLVELYNGDANLINARSRAMKTRDFTVIREMQARAEEKFQAELKKLEEQKNEAQRRINELQAQKDPKQKLVLSKEQMEELVKYRKNVAETNKQLKKVRKELRREQESLETRLKIYNIAGMPLLVSLGGIAFAIYNRKRTAAR